MAKPDLDDVDLDHVADAVGCCVYTVIWQNQNFGLALGETEQEAKARAELITAALQALDTLLHPDNG